MTACGRSLWKEVESDLMLIFVSEEDDENRFLHNVVSSLSRVALPWRLTYGDSPELSNS